MPTDKEILVIISPTNISLLLDFFTSSKYARKNVAEWKKWDWKSHNIMNNYFLRTTFVVSLF